MWCRVILFNRELCLQVEMDSSVIDYLRRQRQKNFWSAEAGGQLFGTISNRDWKITKATGPRPTDRRGRRYYIPDTDAEQAEISAMESQGLVFLGDWHTHFQSPPHPSPSDFSVHQQCVARSLSVLPGFLMLVIGRAFPHDGCALFLVSREQCFEFRLEASPPSLEET